MDPNYRARPDDWLILERREPSLTATRALLELRARVEALEAAQQQPAPPAPAEGLVERVHSCIVGEPECGHMQARAVLREVAAWLEVQRGLAALYYGGLLREEAER